MGKQKKAAGYTLAAQLGINSGVQRLLETPLVINGAEGSTILRFRGADASAAGWPEIGNAGTLVLQAGTAPAYNVPGPWGPGMTPDTGCQFNAGGFFQLASAGLGNITTEDFVIEFIHAGGGGTGFHFGTLIAANGWTFYGGAATDYRFYPKGPGGAGDTFSITTSIGRLHHTLVIYDKSGSCIGYANAVATSATNISTRGSLTSATPLYLGGITGNLDNVIVLYAAIHYRASGWLDSHLQPALAAQRFALLTGSRPLISIASPPATSLAAGGNVGPCYQERIASGAQRLFYMGAGAPRFVQRVDAAGRTFTGALVEAGDASYGGYNRAFGSWLKEGSPTITTGQVGPDGAANAALIEGITGTGGTTIYEAGCVGAGANGTIVRPAIWLKRVSASGVLNIDSSAGVGSGRITCDLAGLPDYWVRLHGASSYCTLVADHVTWGGNGRTGLWLNRSSGADPLSFYLDLTTINEGDYPSSEILVPATTHFHRAADTPHRYSGAGHFGVSKGSAKFTFLSPTFTPGRSHYLQTYYKAAAPTTDYITFWIDTSGYLNVASAATGGSAGSIVKSTNYCDNLVHTVILSWQKNNLRLWVDNVAATSDTSCDFASDMDTVDIGGDNTPGSNQAGPILVEYPFINPRADKWS